MPEDKNVKGTQGGEDIPVVQSLDLAKARSRYIRVLVGERVCVELSPHDLSRGRIIYRFERDAPQPPDVTIEDSQSDIVIEDTFDELSTSINECIAAVAEAHEQIEKNRLEIEALGKETRQLLSELRVA